MKVILTDEVKTLGKRGAVIEVSDGYARNFLLPKKLAVKATKEGIANEQEKLKVEKIKEEKTLGSAKEQAAKLENQAIIIKSKAGESGKLFGAVTSKEIADAIQSQLGIEVDKKKVSIEEDAIKTVGEHPVSVKIHPQVSAKITVNVEAIE